MDVLHKLLILILAPALWVDCLLLDDERVPCGTPVIPAHINRIVGGSPAWPGSWPWMVMLGLNGHQECGGSILNEKFVLSSAHCFDGNRDPSQWKAHIGKYHVTILDPTESTNSIETIIVHPSYDNLTLKNDIALLILREPAVYSRYVRPICLPPTSDRVVQTGTMCYATGWGETRGTGDPSVLNQVALPLLGDYWCSRNDWYGSRFIPGYTFCAGYASGGKDTCGGDSGGPYICDRCNKWYVQGVTSWGYDCAQPHWPGIYTDVSKYGAWIRKTMHTAGFPLHA